MININRFNFFILNLEHKKNVNTGTGYQETVGLQRKFPLEGGKSPDKKVFVAIIELSTSADLA